MIKLIFATAFFPTSRARRVLRFLSVRRLWRVTASTLAMLCLAACAVGPDHQQPDTTIPDEFGTTLSDKQDVPLSQSADQVMVEGLPPFLVPSAGLNSGFMIAHVTAAALASENKSLAHPASVDSLPTSANQEDHVSMATFAARRLEDMAQNTAAIVAIELLCAAQGIDFHAPLLTSERLKKVQDVIRQAVPFYDQDRYLAPDIEALKALVLDESLAATAADLF